VEPKTASLISLAAAYALNCQPCLQYHQTKAASLGLSLEEISQAFFLAEQVKIGAQNKTKRFAETMVNQEAEPEEACCAPGSACCP